MKRKVLSLILLFALFIGQITVFPNFSYAKGEETLDYMGLLKRVREIDPNLLTPKPIFTLTANGETYTVKSDLDIDEPYKNRGEVPYLKDKDGKELTIPVGTKIKLDASPSKVGSGSKIDQYDWQIYKAYSEKEGKYIGGVDEKNTKSVEFVAEKPGDYLIFLNVADNYDKIKDFSNWQE